MNVGGLSSTLQCVVTTLLCVVLCGCSACFIRNCPAGGKRSLDATAPVNTDFHTQRQCMRCGIDGLGQCIGPNICCGPAIGCYVNTIESEVCRHENENPAPCGIDASMCGALPNDGYCMADGVCCTDERCVLDSRCQRMMNLIPSDKRSTKLTPELYKILRRILDRKDYQKRK